MSGAMLSEGEHYWLAHSEGFRVDSHGGRVGLVEEVIDGEPGEPRALIVRAGMMGNRLLVVPVEEVEGIAPRRERIMLRRTPGAGAAGLTCGLLGLRPEAGDGKRAA